MIIKSSIDSNGSKDAPIFLNTWTTVTYNHHKIDVFRHDDNNMLQDVTCVYFVTMESLVLVDGEIGGGPEKGYNPYGKGGIKELNIVSQMSFIWSIFVHFGQFLLQILVNF